MTAKLSLGPILYNWSAEKKLDFYNKIADETPVDIVYLGEVVCNKRLAQCSSSIPKVVERLQSAGKEVIYSSLILLRTDEELEQLRETVKATGLMLEANDMAAVSLMAGKPHCLGPYINIYNEFALEFHAKQKAVRLTLPSELPKERIEILANSGLMDLELQVFGRQPLAISARCAHARAYNLTKRNCQYICEKDPNGLDVFTLDKQPFLSINGLQTLSYTYCNLLNELSELMEMDIKVFRLSPQATDMVEVCKIFHDVINSQQTSEEGNEKLSALLPNVEFSNGFFHGLAGHQQKTLANDVLIPN